MRIMSKVPLVWPHLRFKLDAASTEAGAPVYEGNEVSEADLPPSAHAKLMHLQAAGVISGYSPSPEFVKRANGAPVPNELTQQQSPPAASEADKQQMAKVRADEDRLHAESAKQQHRR